MNTVLQTCFFAISGVLPTDEAIAAIKRALAKSYGRRGPEMVARNNAAVDAAVAGLYQVEVPPADAAVSRPDARGDPGRGVPAQAPVFLGAPEFVRTVTATMLAGRGDDLPVSTLPADGTYPSGTARYEKRNISDLVAVWDPDDVHPVRQLLVRLPAQRHPVHVLPRRPARRGAGRVQVRAARLARAAGQPFTLQIYAEDCTGCGLCVEACPVPLRGAVPTPPPAPSAGAAARRPSRTLRKPGRHRRKAINLEPYDRDTVRRDVAFFETLPVADRSRVDFGTVRGAQFLQPLFEFSGACAGCGETPYLRLLSQLFGDRLLVANATGCSSIYGGNLPTTPWTINRDGRGPAWSNSLFEDNAEFGLGFRLAADQQLALARTRLGELRDAVGAELADEILAAPQARESEYAAQRARVTELTRRLAAMDGENCEPLLLTIPISGSFKGRQEKRARPFGTCCPSWTTWCGAACGSSAVTAGPTTSGRAGSTTCWRPAAT